MAAFFTSILENVESIIEANFNTEIDNIDATLPDVENDSIQIQDFYIVEQGYPWVHIFPDSQSDIDPEMPNNLLKFTWRLITAVSLSVTNNTQGIKELDKYMSALCKTLIKGTGTDNWSVDGTARLIQPVRWGHTSFELETREDIIKSGFIEWEVETTINPTS